MRVEAELIVQEYSHCEDRSDCRNALRERKDEARWEKEPPENGCMVETEPSGGDRPPRFIDRVLSGRHVLIGDAELE